MKVSACTVYGKVRGAPRPRVTRNVTYMPKEYTAYKTQIAEAYREQGGEHYGGKPVGVTIDVFRTLPKSRPKKVDSEPDTFKPDADNIAKTVLDALNGVAFDDDAQATQVIVRKWPRKRQEERLEIMIGALK